MRFTNPQMEADFERIHPELRSLLQEFEKVSNEEDWPEPVITDLVRTPEDQIRIYVAHFKRLQASMVLGRLNGLIDPEGDGSFRPLTTPEWTEAMQVKDMSEDELYERARLRFTWHWVACAADLRTRHYSKPQLSKVSFWFGQKTYSDPKGRKLWECLVHDVTAPHLHVARRDEAWKVRFLPHLEKPEGSSQA